MDFFTFMEMTKFVDDIDSREGELLKREAEKSKTPLDDYIDKHSQ